jgi:DNA-binding transcriptional MerR regulator
VDHPHALFTIGEVARRTGLSTRTIRFYSDAGLVPACDRGPAGHRLFDAEAVARLELVRTLRTLDIDLPTISRVLDRNAPLTAVAEAHAEAIAIQIRTLQLRRSVLLAVARHPEPTSPGAVTVMTRLAHMSEEQRQDLINAFWDEMCDGLDLDPEAERRMRAARPELPDAPSPEQVEAWIEFAELVEDPDFRARVRAMTSFHSRQRREAGNDMTVHTDEEGLAVAEAVQLARDAEAEGIDPGSRRAAAVVADILPAFNRLPSVGHGSEDDSDLRARLADRLEVRTDERAERYSQLLEIINGVPRTPPTTPAMRWLVAALRAPDPR